MAWRDRHNLYVLINTHNLPTTQGDVCDEQQNIFMPQTVKDCNQHRVQWQRWSNNQKQPTVAQYNGRHRSGGKKNNLHLLIMTTVSSFVLLTSCVKATHQRVKPDWKCWEFASSPSPIGTPAFVEKRVTWFEVNFSNYWPLHSCWIVTPVWNEEYEKQCN